MRIYQYTMVNKIPYDMYYKIKAIKDMSVAEVSDKYDIAPNLVRRINPSLIAVKKTDDKSEGSGAK